MALHDRDFYARAFSKGRHDKDWYVNRKIELESKLKGNPKQNEMRRRLLKQLQSVTEMLDYINSVEEA